MSVVQKFSKNEEPAQRWVAVTRIGPLHDSRTDSDAVAVEEPLEIRLGVAEHGGLRHQAVSITMRTPGDDFELAAGFLFTEGILQSPGQVAMIEHCGRDSSPTNIIRVDLKPGITVDLKRLERNFYTTSSCGVCGKGSLEALSTGARRVSSADTFKVPIGVIDAMPATLREAQQTFASTGGLHAAGLFTTSGELLGLREDVGRHNAVDKLIGARFLADALPANDAILFLSGRASFELLQKAVMAGIPMVCAVGAPSSLAIAAARDFGVTLLGFVRDRRCNVYSGAERLEVTGPA
jgi:FdhD protein